MKQGNHGNSHGQQSGGEGVDRKLHNPIEDRLIPLEPLDLQKVSSIDGLVRAMAKTAFTGRQLGEAADVLEAMALDEDAFVVMTLAGAMTVAKQGLIITELIDRGIVNAIVSTGALMAHGLVEATGRAHFRANPEVSDEELYEQGYNRVYDTLEPEQNLDDVEEPQRSHVLLQTQPCDRGPSLKERPGAAGNPEVRLRKGRASFRTRLQRLGTGIGHSSEQPSSRVDRKAQDPV